MAWMLPGRAAEHLLGLVADGEHLLLAAHGGDRDHRRLVQHDAPALDVDPACWPCPGRWPCRPRGNREDWRTWSGSECPEAPAGGSGRDGRRIRRGGKRARRPDRTRQRRTPKDRRDVPDGAPEWLTKACPPAQAAIWGRWGLVGAGRGLGRIGRSRAASPLRSRLRDSCRGSPRSSCFCLSRVVLAAPAWAPIQDLAGRWAGRWADGRCRDAPVASSHAQAAEVQACARTNPSEEVRGFRRVAFPASSGRVASPLKTLVHGAPDVLVPTQPMDPRSLQRPILPSLTSGTPRTASPRSAHFRAAESERPSTMRLSAGSMMPSSHSRALA